MGDVAAFLWPISLMGAAGIAGKCAMLWLELRAKALIRAEERDERETGAFAKLKTAFEQLEREMSAMRTEQKTFIANNRR